MTLFTSGDWIVDNEREITFGVFEFMCKKFPLLVGAEVEVIEFMDVCLFGSDAEAVSYTHLTLPTKA